MRPLEFWNMSPADFNALCEGYENKKRSEQELMRQQTFIMVSPYMDKGAGYERFKRKWQFGWEQIELPAPIILTKEEQEALIKRHAKYIKPKK